MKPNLTLPFITGMLCIMCASLFQSCAKKSTPTPTPPGPDAKTMALTSGQWKRSQWEGKHKDGTWRTLIMTDNQSSLRYTYTADHTYTGTAFEQGQNVSFSGTWAFANHETVIVIRDSQTPNQPDSTTYTIISATTLQEKEADFKFTLPPELTGSATDTTFYGWRFTWGH